VRELGGGLSTGDPGRYVEKALETGFSFHQGCAGERGRGLIRRGHRKMNEGGAVGMGHLSPRELCKGNFGRRAALLVTPKDMLRC